MLIPQQIHNTGLFASQFYIFFRGKEDSFIRKLFIPVLIHQPSIPFLSHLAGDLNLRNPSLILRLLIDDRRFGLERLIGGNDFPAHGSENVRGRFHAFDCPDGVTRGDFLTDRWEFDVDDVAER